MHLFSFMHIKITSVLPEAPLFFHNLMIAARTKRGAGHVTLPYFRANIAFRYSRDGTLKQSVPYMSVFLPDWSSVLAGSQKAVVKMCRMDEAHLHLKIFTRPVNFLFLFVFSNFQLLRGRQHILKI
jgi:hypothetical protein